MRLLSDSTSNSYNASENGSAIELGILSQNKTSSDVDKSNDGVKIMTSILEKHNFSKLCSCVPGMSLRLSVIVVAVLLVVLSSGMMWLIWSNSYNDLSRECVKNSAISLSSTLSIVFSNLLDSLMVVPLEYQQLYGFGVVDYNDTESVLMLLALSLMRQTKAYRKNVSPSESTFVSRQYQFPMRDILVATTEQFFGVSLEEFRPIPTSDLVDYLDNSIMGNFNKSTDEARKFRLLHFYTGIKDPSAFPDCPLVTSRITIHDVISDSVMTKCISPYEYMNESWYTCVQPPSPDVPPDFSLMATNMDFSNYFRPLEDKTLSQDALVSLSKYLNVTLNNIKSELDQVKESISDLFQDLVLNSGSDVVLWLRECVEKFGAGHEYCQVYVRSLYFSALAFPNDDRNTSALNSVFSVKVDVSMFQDLLQSYKQEFQQFGIVFVVDWGSSDRYVEDPHMRIVAHSAHSIENFLKIQEVLQILLDRNINSDYDGLIDKTWIFSRRLLPYSKVRNFQWTLVIIGLRSSTFFDELSEATHKSIGSAVGIIVLSILVAIFSGWYIMRPIHKLELHMKSLLSDETNLEYLECSDELSIPTDFKELASLQGATGKKFMSLRSELREANHDRFELARVVSILKKSHMTMDSSLRHLDLSLFIGTWNVGNMKPNKMQVKDWLLGHGWHDIVAVGVQECVYEERNSQAHFFEMVELALGPRYYRVACANIVSGGLLKNASSSVFDSSKKKGLGGLQETIASEFTRVDKAIDVTKTGGLRLIVMARREHRPNITDVVSAREATGIASVLWNKGAVGISLKFYETSLCFITSHLAAHQDKAERRNRDYYEILQGLRLNNSHLLPYNFHHLFWFGDLNYRIDLSRNIVSSLIDSEDWISLRLHDQLIREVAARRAFAGFEEPEIAFRPTFKYENGTDNYEVKKMRIPSWCDRILYRSRPGLPIQVREYGCDMSVKTSDHKPVYGVFDLKAALSYVPLSMSTPCVLVFSNIQAVTKGPKAHTFRHALLRVSLACENNTVSCKQISCKRYSLQVHDLKDTMFSVDDNVCGTTPNETKMLSTFEEAVIRPIIFDETFLRNEHIIFDLFDKDNNSLRIEAVLALKDILVREGKSTPFSLSLDNGTSKMNPLRGICTLVRDLDELEIIKERSRCSGCPINNNNIDVLGATLSENTSTLETRSTTPLITVSNIDDDNILIDSNDVRSLYVNSALISPRGSECSSDDSEWDRKEKISSDKSLLLGIEVIPAALATTSVNSLEMETFSSHNDDDHIRESAV